MSQVYTQHYTGVANTKEVCPTLESTRPFHPRLAIKHTAHQAQSTNLKFTTYSSAIIGYQQLVHHEREAKPCYNWTDIVFHFNNT